MHRLASEPRRLALRYVENALFLIPHLSKQVLATSLQPRNPRESGVSFLRSDHSLTATVVGSFSGAIVEAFVDGVKGCTGECSLILDLTSSTSIAPDAAGAILHLAYERARAGRELWVVSEKPFQRKAIRAAFPAGEPFRTALTLQDALRLVTAQQFKSR